MKNLKEEWQKSFEQSLKNIDKFTQITHRDHPEEISFKKLAKWMLTTTYSSYAYMTHPLQNYLADPYTTECVLSTLHHAMLDDGEVSFVSMKLEEKTIRVFMIFLSNQDDCFVQICQKENESLISSSIKSRELLNSTHKERAQQSPEKTRNIKPLIKKEDFVFEAHTDSIRFIKEFKEFQVLEQEKRERISQKMAKLRNGI
jgi:hypothetical protein